MGALPNEGSARVCAQLGLPLSFASPTQCKLYQRRFVTDMVFDMHAWNPQETGLKVRLRDNPGRQGTTTGRTKTAGTFLMVEVDFGPNEKQFKRYELLEPISGEADLFELLETGVFGGPSDLRRVLTFEKIKGELTNIFYSMEASNTVF